VATLFETERLVVRKTSLEDIDALLAILADPDTVRLFGSSRPWSRAEVERFVRSYPDSDSRLISAPGLALLKPDLEVVGFGGVVYYVAEGNTADLLFVVDRRHWGHGLATELARAALAAALAAALRHPEVAIVHATVHPANLALLCCKDGGCW
jgi:ribosomal-protein-alanine N-acetyltransferase